MNFQVSEEKVADYNEFLFGGFLEFQSHQNFRSLRKQIFSFFFFLERRQEGRREGEREGKNEREKEK